MEKFLVPSLALLLFSIPCSTFSAENSPFVFMAGTIGHIDAGIVSALEDQFEKETGFRVRHVGDGTNQGLDHVTEMELGAREEITRQETGT